MSHSSSAVPSQAELTQEQIDRVSRYLAMTSEALVDSTARLSSAQWEFKPATDRWSIAEIVEHLVLIEARVQSIVGGMSEAPEAAYESDPTQIDEFIFNEVPKRSKKINAPALVCPIHQWSGAEGIEHFTESRQQTIRLLLNSSLRGHVVPHPVHGPWDGYQWLLAAAAHTARHTEQIGEVKSDPNFP
jgi:DinB superfamily